MVMRRAVGRGSHGEQTSFGAFGTRVGMISASGKIEEKGGVQGVVGTLFVALGVLAESTVGMLDPTIHRTLTAFDGRLVDALHAGDIRLIRCEWLLLQPKGSLLPLERAIIMKKLETTCEWRVRMSQKSHF